MVAGKRLLQSPSILLGCEKLEVNIWHGGLRVVIWVVVVVRGLHVEEGGLYVVIQGGGAWSTCGGKGGEEMGWTAGVNPLLTIPTHAATSATIAATTTSGSQA